MRIWRCLICDYVYDESQGDADHGIPPGTAWDDVLEDFVCPECGARKSDFVPVEF